MAAPYWRYPPLQRGESAPGSGFPLYQSSSGSILPPANYPASSGSILPPANYPASSGSTLPPANYQASSGSTLLPANYQASSGSTLLPAKFQTSSSSILPPSNNWIPRDLPVASSNYLQNNAVPPASVHSGGYRLGDVSAPVHRGISAPVGLNGYSSPLQVPMVQGQDLPDNLHPDRSNLTRTTDELIANESSILFVGGLPTDCTRREISHLFRPFIGFKEIRVIHKEPRQVGEKPSVLCFVEFKDAKCAFTAMDALQGYRFDDKKPDSPSLKIQFAKFPFRPPATDDHGFSGTR